MYAKQLLIQNKRDKAKLAIQKKKYQEQLLEKTTGQLDNIKTMIDSLEFAKMEKEVFDSLKFGTKQLQEIQKEMTIENVEKIMEDSREAIEYQNEISRIMSQSLTKEDEDDVMKEVNAMEAEFLNSRNVSTAKTPLVMTTKTSPSYGTSAVEDVQALQISKEPLFLANNSPSKSLDDTATNNGNVELQKKQELVSSQ